MADQVPVELLTRRLAETPGVFLTGEVVVAAVLSDVLADRGLDPLDEEWLAALGAPTGPAQAAWQRLVGVVAWLLADPRIGGLATTPGVLGLLRGDLHQLAEDVAPQAVVTDGDRREELARLLLRAIGVVPAGETAAQAADRLATLDTATRLRVIAEAREAEEHAQKVRAALAKKRAQQAAAKAMRE